MKSSEEKDVPKGFTCKCGTEHLFSLYVYAHWRDDLEMTCESCGRKHAIRAGRTRVLP